MLLDYTKNWLIVGELDGGGQGKVYRVIPKEMGNTVDMKIIQAIKEISNPNASDDHRKPHYQTLRENLVALIERENPANQRALKVLHKPQDARDAELADVRIRREIKAMAEIRHPNLLKILDYDVNLKWYVSEYFPRGSVCKNREIFAGNFAAALRAFRPLVHGLSELHKKKLVHRDIKPENVFLDSKNNLILGDFGLVFFMDDDKARLSHTLENVGSRDWMPAWAQGVRIEEIKPTFDVFSLGKLLWYLLSGKPKLRLWYFQDPEFNVENLFPEDRFIRLANPLFSRCIVEREDNCLTDASALLEEVDKVLLIMEMNADRIDPQVKRRCKVCGLGYYRLEVDKHQSEVENFGLRYVGNRKWKVFTCSHCGNVQLFSYAGEAPEAWQDH
jgi:serine/threonine protein kinase